MTKLSKLIEFAEGIKDKRVSRKIKYPLKEIILCAFVGILTGCTDWEMIEDFCKAKIEILRTILPFANGIPGHDTIRRIFEIIDHKKFQDFLIEWARDCFGIEISGEVYAIDGKQCKGSKFSNNDAVHNLNIFAIESGLVIAQQDIPNKGGEIEAVHKLLDILDLKGATLTLDALHCQKSTAKKINDAEANYVIGLKANQGYLHYQTKQQFEAMGCINESMQIYTTTEKAHGREETRQYTVLHDVSGIKVKDEWESLCSVIMVESNVSRKKNKPPTQEKRYYISNIPHLEAKKASMLIRGHWGIENNLHWILDVVFNEDKSRVTKNAAKNLTILRKMAHNCLIPKKNPKMSLARMVRNLNFSDQHLTKFLMELKS